MERRKTASQTDDLISPTEEECDKNKISSYYHGEEFRYGGVIFRMLLPPVVVLLAFGGRPALLTACFGGIVAYIFDLLGAVEGTLMAVFVSMFAMWAALVWAARNILKETIVNFSLVLLMGVLLFYCFIIAASNFRSLLNEFDTVFYFLEVFIFATLPLLSSAVLTWFICVEIPTIDLSTCFALCYAVYTFVLAKPRLASFPSRLSPSTSTSSHDKAKNYRPNFVLSFNTVTLVYIIPILFTPILKIAVKIGVLKSFYASATEEVFVEHLLDLGFSLLLPVLLMCVCAEQHIQYVSPQRQQNILSTLHTLKLVIGAGMLASLQGHHLIDDLKDYSGLPKILATAALCAVFALVGLAVFIRSSFDAGVLAAYAVKYRSLVGLGRSAPRLNSGSSTVVIFVSLCLAGAAMIAGILLKLPLRLLLLSGAGASSAAAFYQKGWVTGSTANQIIGLVMVLFATCAVALVSHRFSSETLYFLSYSFHWNGIEINTQQFCTIFSALAASAIAIPTQAYGSVVGITTESLFDAASEPLPVSGNDSGGQSRDLFDSESGFGLEPGSGLDMGATSRKYKAGISVSALENSSYWWNVAPVVFTLSFPLFAAAQAAVELLVREQSWGSLGFELHVDTEEVYSASLVLATAAAFIVTAASLLYHNVTSVWSCWAVMVIQTCKLLHLFGVSSVEIVIAIAVISAYSLPFAAHVKELLSTSGSGEFKCSAKQFLFYIAVSTGITFWARTHLAGAALSLVTLRDGHSSTTHVIAACLALWSAHLSIVLMTFYPVLTAIRSLFIICALASTAVATEVLGPVTFSIDSSSSTYIVVSMHPDFAPDHGVLFLLLTVALAVSASLNLLPINRPLSRLFFAISFAFISSRALLPWAFPLSLSEESESHDWYHLPSVFCFASALLGTSALLHSSRMNTSTSGAWIFVLSSCTPLAALLMSSVMDSLRDQFSGIVWTTVIINASIGISTRVSELLRDVDNIRAALMSSTGASSRAESSKRVFRTNPVASSICVTSICMALLWLLVGTLSSQQSRYSDIVIPISTLLFLFTKRGVLLPAAYHPVALSTIASSAWWSLSIFYSVFVKGYGGDVKENVFESEGGGVFLDENVSFWNATSLWLPWLTLALSVVPVPALVTVFLRRRDDTEEIMFVLAVLCVLPVIGAQITSARLLGITGLCCASWRCYDIGAKRKTSNHLI